MKRSETKSLLQPISSITIKRKTIIIALWVRQWIISQQQPINYNLNRLKHQADELLLSEEGIRHRKQRPCDVEAVFGEYKKEPSL